MNSTREALTEFRDHLDESMGVRRVATSPKLSPVASPKDVGRLPIRKFGRLEIKQVSPDPNQPRSQFDEVEIERLAGNIRRLGQLHPIRVRWDAATERWIIVTGERRYRATVRAGLTHIDCFFHENDISQPEILEQQLVENLLRRDLQPLEEARGYAALMELNGWNGKQVAEALQVSPSKVSRALALLDLPDTVQSRIQAGELARSSAYELSKLDNQETIAALAELAASESMSQQSTAKAVRQRKGKASVKNSRLQQTFVAQNGLKVQVSANRRGNYHEVEEALQEAIEEVQLRIHNNVQIF